MQHPVLKNGKMANHVEKLKETVQLTYQRSISQMPLLLYAVPTALFNFKHVQKEKL